MNERVITVPILPAVKKFVIECWGAEPIDCTQRNIAGRQLRALMAKKSKATYPNASKVTISLKLSSSLWDSKGQILFHAKSNYIFRDFFEASLIGFVNGHASTSKSRRKSFLAFAAIYGIDSEEMDYENFERDLNARSGNMRVKRMTKISEEQSAQKRLEALSRSRRRENELRRLLKEKEKELAVEKELTASLEKSFSHFQSKKNTKNVSGLDRGEKVMQKRGFVS